MAFLCIPRAQCEEFVINAVYIVSSTEPSGCRCWKKFLGCPALWGTSCLQPQLRLKMVTPFSCSAPPSWAKSISRVDKAFLQWSHGEAWQRWGSWDRHTDSQVTWNAVIYVWVPDDGEQQALCIFSELGTITITPPLLVEYLSLSCLERAQLPRNTFSLLLLLKKILKWRLVLFGFYMCPKIPMLKSWSPAEGG